MPSGQALLLLRQGDACRVEAAEVEVVEAHVAIQTITPLTL
jgi:hypothetical protein